MNIPPVTFGKKIPIAKCHIKDLKNDKYVAATCYKIDCTDTSDSSEIWKLDGDWEYNDVVAHNIDEKHRHLEGIGVQNSLDFYEMQTDKKKEIIGICQVNKTFGDIRLDYLESKPDKGYKYIGQSMLAILGEVAKSEGIERIYIPTPVEEARSFYRDKCGFKEAKDTTAMYMNKNKFKKLKIKAERNTHSKIINCMV